MSKLRCAPLVLSLAVVVGCGDEATTGDGGGVGPDGQVAMDAGGGTLCARDRDCDDGMYCNGEERCRPGADGANPATGCVAGEAPCDPDSETCSERDDACELDDCSDGGDSDGDGDARPACGGHDCDDEDPTRFSTAQEVCDAAGVDEDCDPTTLYNDSVDENDGDRDGDGHVEEMCANIVDGEEVARGDDCDDTDPAVYAGAAERCNGVDDDCDGSIDEDYECPQGAAMPGTNACGTEGTRRCASDCTWLDSDYWRDESAATCNYCDDTGRGLDEERLFATASGADTIDASNLHGTASEETVFGARLILLGTAGSAVTSTPITVGYGQVEFTASLDFLSANDSPEYGWSLVVLHEPPASFAGDASDYGQPRDSDGIAVEWHWSGPNDAFYLRRLTASGADAVIQRSFSAFPPLNDLASAEEQTLRLTITPDDPATPEDETRVESSDTSFRLAQCGHLRSETCRGFSVQPGDNLWFAVTAGSSTTGSSTDISTYLVDANIARANICP